LEENRAISVEEAKAFADQHNLIYIETSAKTSNNVDVAFIDTAKEILSKIENAEYDLSNEQCGIKIGNSTLKESFTRKSAASGGNCEC
jgi:Ras-related protein Rab-2A